MVSGSSFRLHREPGPARPGRLIALAENPGLQFSVFRFISAGIGCMTAPAGANPVSGYDDFKTRVDRERASGSSDLKALRSTAFEGLRSSSDALLPDWARKERSGSSTSRPLKQHREDQVSKPFPAESRQV